MNTKEKALFSYCERSFDPKETMRQIHHNAKVAEVIVNEWNIDPRIGVLCSEEEDEPNGMVFKVNHQHYTDMVMITLSWNDTYHIRFLNEQMDVTHEIEEVYCDQLFDSLDHFFKIGHLFSNLHLN